jgi:hypothetical protein
MLARFIATLHPRVVSVVLRSPDGPQSPSLEPHTGELPVAIGS